METLELVRMCRLCGKQLDDTMAIHIFGSPENYEKKIRSLLPIWIHEMDDLPKYLCCNCTEKLQDFYKFYIQTLELDINMKNKLSWMKTSTGERHDKPIVYFADLHFLKIKSEGESFEQCNTMDLDPNPPGSINIKCSVKSSDENFPKKNFDCLSTSTTSDIEKRHFKDKKTRPPLTLANPLVHVNNQLPGSGIVRVFGSKDDITDPQNQTRYVLTYHKDKKIDDRRDNDNTNKTNCHLSTMPEILLKCETKQNDEFIRKLRFRQNVITNKPLTKVMKKEQIKRYAVLKTNYKSKNSMTDVKLRKKVKIKVVKLDCSTMTQRKGIL